MKGDILDNFFLLVHIALHMAMTLLLEHWLRRRRTNTGMQHGGEGGEGGLRGACRGSGRQLAYHRVRVSYAEHDYI